MKKFYGILLCFALMAFKNVNAQTCADVTSTVITPTPESMLCPGQQVDQNTTYSYSGAKVSIAATYGQDITVTGNIVESQNSSNSRSFTLTIPTGELSSQTCANYLQMGASSSAQIQITSVSPCPSSVIPPLSANNGVFTFSSLAVYEEYADNTADRDNIINLYTGSTGLTTLAEIDTSENNEDNDYPEFLKMVLNTDSIFSFSHYLVKIDLPNHRALVIDANNSNAYQSLLTNDLNAAGMMNFSDDVDNAITVLTEIESGRLLPSQYTSAIEHSSSTARSCPGASERKDKDDYPYIWYNGTDPWSICPDLSILVAQDNKVVYQRAIVYFSLQSKIRSVFGCSSTNWIGAPLFFHANLIINGTVKFSKRCEPEQTFVNLSAGRFRQAGAVKTWRPYEGSRSLSKYDFTVTFGAKLLGATNYSLSRQYHIIYGY